jgi:hypothetical protein
MFSKARIRQDLVSRVCYRLVIELVGEEIYNEFNIHGQGTQLSSFIPTNSDVGGTVTTIAVNGPGHDVGHHCIHATGHRIHTQNLGSGNGPLIGSGLGFGPAMTHPIALSERRAWSFDEQKQGRTSDSKGPGQETTSVTAQRVAQDGLPQQQ